MTATTTPTEALEALALDGILPFLCTVQVRELGQWVSEAQGSSVAWLVEALEEAAEVYGRARILSQYGTTLAEVDPRTSAQIGADNRALYGTTSTPN